MIGEEGGWGRGKVGEAKEDWQRVISRDRWGKPRCARA